MSFDLVIRDAKVVDGTGRPAFLADVGVRGERIECIGRIRADAKRVIDAEGLVLAPGFIDVHTHDDHALLSKPDMAFKASQGVATVVVGSGGGAPCAR